MYARFKWFIRQVSWLVLTAVFSTNPWSVRADAEEILDAVVAYSGDNVGTIADEKALRRAFFAAPTDGTAVTVTLGADITLETLYAAENFGTEKLDDNAEGDTFNRYKVGVHPTAEDPNHWNPLVTDQTQEQRLVYGAYYHMSATDERIARLVVKSGQKIVLDLNGHTIQKNARATHGDWSEVCTDIIGNYGTLEIVDSSTGAKGTIKGIGYTTCGGAVLHNYAGATMTVTGVNVDGNAAGMAKGTGQYAIANEGGTLTLDGVNVHDTATSASLIMSNGGTVTIKNATLSHPATKVINAKGGVINIESASVTSEKYAVFVTGDARVNVNGSLTIEGTGTLCVEGDAAALTKKPGVELSAPAGFTWVENDGVQVLKSFVAKVGETAYVTIAEAIAVLSAENHTLTLLKDAAWDAATPVYWAAGAQSGYAATLTVALTAAYKANEGAITIVCRPGADVGEMTHGHVADDLTIYGNDAYLSGGECDLEVDTYTFSRATGAQAADGVCLDKDITITAYELDNLGVWGERHTANKVTVNLTDCDGKALEGKTNVQRVYISGTTGVNNITLTDCDFLTKATAVYSNADGAIKAVNCSFTDGQVPFNINHKANGTQTVALTGCRFTNCGDVGGWKQFAAPLRLVNSGTGTQSAEVTGCAFAGTVGANGDILLGDGRTGQAWTRRRRATTASPTKGTLETSVAKLLPVNDGSEAHPYSREQFAAMTRAEYRAAQKRLGGTLYVNVGDYTYEEDGVLGNGVRDNTPGQVPDHSKLNAYGENGYLGEKNDGANGQTVVFVGGTITSGVTGYTSIDNIGTSLLLAVPAYTKVAFKKTAFKNVLSFDYQLYTSPWSQLGGLTFNGCTFDGIIVGAIAAQELAFNGCTFNNYVNTTSANSSNPTWIRPAYGNWTKGDNEGQGTDFRSLTNITFADNTVTSTRPVKFERMAQWEMATTVKVTNNTFDITPQEGDTSTKNVGLYFGANAKFDLVVDKNEKSDGTAALYTAVYKAPTDVTYVGLPAGSTVKDTAGNDVTAEDALAWKTTDKITLKTTEEVASVTNAKGVSVNFATLADAIAAAKVGETVKLLADTNGDGIAIAPNTFTTGLTVDFGGHTYTVGGLLVGSTGTASNGFQLNAGNRITFKNGAIVGATATAGAGTDWKGAPAILIQNYCDLTLEQMTVKGGDETCYTLSNNNGEIVIDGSTIVAGKGTKCGPFAFDVCRYASYPSVHVTVKGASVIEGNVEISGTIGDNQSRQLDIEGGTFKGAFTVAGNIPANIAISGGTFATAIDAAYCAEGFIPTANGDGTYGVKEGTYVAQIGTTGYETLQTAFDAAKTGDTVTLLSDITLTEQVNITKALDGLTLDGNGKTITCATTDDPRKSGGSALYFGNANDHLYCTGIKIKDLTMTGTARFAIFLCGGTTTEFTNVKISGNYYIAVNLYGTHGATMTDCDISNNTTGTDKYISAIWSNVASANPLTLNNSKVDVIAINAYTTANKLEPKIFVMDGSEVGEIHTFDDGSISGNKKLCVSAESTGSYVVKGYDASTQTWVDICVVAAIGAIDYETLEAALAAAQDGDTVKLLVDITHEGSQLVIAADKRLTLDLNGKTLKVSKFTAKAAQVSVWGSLTVTDGSAAQTGVICSDYTGTAGLVVCVEENGALTMKGGRITTEGMAQAGNAVKIATGGTVEMTGGTIVCDAKRNNVAVNLAGSSRFTMTGGSVVADNGESTTAILAKTSESTLAIRDAAKVSGPTAVSAKSAATTISGGTFEGTIKANKGVSGGTFDREVPLDVCTDYHESLKNEDGSYGIFPFTAIDVKTSIDGAATVRVRVSRSLLDRAGGTTLEEKAANLGKPEANGNLAWVNGVMGLEADKAVHAVDVPQNKYTKEDGVFIQAPVPVPKNSDAAVSYSIDGVDADGRVIEAGTEKTSGSLKIVLADIETSARFRVNVFVRSNDGTTVAKLVSENTVGVLKTATSAKKAIIAVPWLSLADGGNISVANLVKTAGLTEGDRLNVYNKAEKRYDVYELTAGKAWNPIAIYKIGADGAVETASSGSPEATTVARGSGVWLERQDTKQPIVSYGQVPTEEVMTTIDAGTKEAPTWNLLAVPTTEAVDLAATFGTDANDRILVPTKGAPRVYTVEDGAWGATKTMEVIDRWGNKTGGVKVIREAVTTLPAGTGFWYLNGGNATKVNW